MCIVFKDKFTNSIDIELLEPRFISQVAFE